jgi:predicted transcriptional regulator
LLEGEIGGRRGFEEIVASIIAACKTGERKTKIMYNSMLNVRQLNRYLEFLAEKGFVRNEDGRFYVATVRGIDYLKEYEGMVKNRMAVTALHREVTAMLGVMDGRIASRPEPSRKAQ